MYDQIHKFRNEGHKSIQWIADYLRVNFRTVNKYLKMNRSEFEKFPENITNKSFTSESASIAHEKAFDYFHGIPGYIIHDQDAVFLYNENMGLPALRSFTDWETVKSCCL
jgi:hypothetical protein